MIRMALARVAIWGAAGLAAACGSTVASTSGGPACAHATDCGADAVCVCPDGGRACASAVCLTLCQPAGDGGGVCPTGGACVDEKAACCQGVPSCTLNCLHALTCAP
jgi:hypothetical protein